MEVENNRLRKEARKYILQKFFCDKHPDHILTESESETYSIDGSGRPETFFIRMNIKVFLSDLSIRLDAETGELLNWCFAELYKNAESTILTREEALKIASEYIHLPEDAALDEFFQEQQENSHITNLTWKHCVSGLEVENDSILIQINSKTKEVIAVSKIWNEVPEQIERIDINEAKRITERLAPRYVKNQQYDITMVEKKYIPLIFKDESNNPHTKIVKVWQINLREPAKKFPPKTILSIDCYNGEIVRVEHSK